MRLKIKQSQNLKEGEVRVCKGFLWLPKYLDREWRWLEFAEWAQMTMRLPPLAVEVGCYSPGQTPLQWVSTEWR